MSTIGATSVGCARKAALVIGLVFGVGLVVVIVVTPLLVLVGPPVGLAALAGLACVTLVVRRWIGRSDSA